MVKQWNSLSELWVTTRSTISALGLSFIHRVMLSPMVSRSRASVVEKTLIAVNSVDPIPTSLPPNGRPGNSPLRSLAVLGLCREETLHDIQHLGLRERDERALGTGQDL